MTPKRPKNSVIYNKNGIIIIERNSEIFGTQFYLFAPIETCNGLSFNTLKDAFDYLSMFIGEVDNTCEEESA